MHSDSVTNMIASYWPHERKYKNESDSCRPSCCGKGFGHSKRASTDNQVENVDESHLNDAQNMLASIEVNLISFEQRVQNNSRFIGTKYYEDGS